MILQIRRCVESSLTGFTGLTGLDNHVNLVNRLAPHAPLSGNDSKGRMMGGRLKIKRFLVFLTLALVQCQAAAFYNPKMGRWTTRDPIEEEGGKNLYAFCANNPISLYDMLGCAHFEVRRLSFTPGIMNYSCFGQIIGWMPALALDMGLADKLNIEILHEHLFYDDGTNIGYDQTGPFSEKTKKGYRRRDPVEYDDCIMKEAQKRVPQPPYSLLGFGGKQKFNCQDYADSLRREYNRLLEDKEVRCKCKREK